MAKKVMKWERPSNIRRKDWNSSRWTDEELAQIEEIGYDWREAVVRNLFPGRTKKAVMIKCGRIRRALEAL